MPLSPGTKLGPYEIVAPLGAGGMGEVYRARDTRLGRDVAVKVLPEHLSSNPEVRTRFEREAKTVSSLNHPNICTLFDVGREGEVDFLVMELIEGETLVVRIARGPLATAEVLRLGILIADALDRAHRAGVVHRDLKPGNIMLTKNGAKLMDFGLARATAGAGPVSGSGATMAMLTHAPTMASPLTAEGAIVGTFQYMSPEQLEGREADTRADLWALGCVLYEMATGKRPFEGRSQASLISSIMTSEPAPLASLAPMTPPAFENLVRALLAKDPDDRVQTAHDVKLQLQWIAASGSQSGAAAVAPVALRGRARTASWLMVAIAAAAAFAAGAFLMPHGAGDDGARVPMKLRAPIPPDLEISTAGADLALSPDGRTLLFVARDSAGTSSLWLRPLDGKPMQHLEATDAAYMPFWSPDGRSVAFFAAGKRCRTSLTAGAPEDICPAGKGRGGSWGKDDVIIFAPDANSPIMRVSAQGGTPVAATRLEAAKHEVGHRFPRFLPDGTHFIYATMPSVEKEHEMYLAQLGSLDRKFIVRATSEPAVTSDGWLLFNHGNLLSAQMIDVGSGKLLGQSRPLFTTAPGGGFQASPVIFATPSVLVCLPPRIHDDRLAWVDRSGRVEFIAGLPSGGWSFQAAPWLSADGTKVISARGSEQSTSSSGSNIWLADVARGLATRLTFNAVIDAGGLWAPDGNSFYFSSNVSGSYQLYRKPVHGAGEAQFVAKGPSFVIQASDCTRDGRLLVCDTENPGTGGDIYVVATDSTHAARPLIASNFAEAHARLSPDGRWIAYTSDESGRQEIYVQAFPGLGTKMQVSQQGGDYPVWTRDGRELLFAGRAGSVMSSALQNGTTLTAASPVRVCEVKTSSRSGFDVSPDGKRFLFALSGDDPTLNAPVVVVNWKSMLQEH